MFLCYQGDDQIQLDDSELPFVIRSPKSEDVKKKTDNQTEVILSPKSVEVNIEKDHPTTVILSPKSVEVNNEKDKSTTVILSPKFLEVNKEKDNSTTVILSPKSVEVNKEKDNSTKVIFSPKSAEVNKEKDNSTTVILSPKSLEVNKEKDNSTTVILSPKFVEVNKEKDNSTTEHISMGITENIKFDNPSSPNVSQTAAVDVDELKIEDKIDPATTQVDQSLNDASDLNIMNDFPDPPSSDDEPVDNLMTVDYVDEDNEPVSTLLNTPATQDVDTVFLPKSEETTDTPVERAKQPRSDKELVCNEKQIDTDSIKEDVDELVTSNLESMSAGVDTDNSAGQQLCAVEKQNTTAAKTSGAVINESVTTKLDAIVSSPVIKTAIKAQHTVECEQNISQQVTPKKKKMRKTNKTQDRPSLKPDATLIIDATAQLTPSFEDELIKSKKSKLTGTSTDTKKQPLSKKSPAPNVKEQMPAPAFSWIDDQAAPPTLAIPPATARIIPPSPIQSFTGTSTRRHKSLKAKNVTTFSPLTSTPQFTPILSSTQVQIMPRLNISEAASPPLRSTSHSYCGTESDSEPSTPKQVLYSPASYRSSSPELTHSSVWPDVDSSPAHHYCKSPTWDEMMQQECGSLEMLTPQSEKAMQREYDELQLYADLTLQECSSIEFFTPPGAPMFETMSLTKDMAEDDRDTGFTSESHLQIRGLPSTSYISNIEPQAGPSRLHSKILLPHPSTLMLSDTKPKSYRDSVRKISAPSSSVLAGGPPTMSQTHRPTEIKASPGKIHRESKQTKVVTHDLDYMSTTKCIRDLESIPEKRLHTEKSEPSHKVNQSTADEVNQTQMRLSSIVSGKRKRKSNLVEKEAVDTFEQSTSVTGENDDKVIETSQHNKGEDGGDNTLQLDESKSVAVSNVKAPTSYKSPSAVGEPSIKTLPHVFQQPSSLELPMVCAKSSIDPTQQQDLPLCTGDTHIISHISSDTTKSAAAEKHLPIKKLAVSGIPIATMQPIVEEAATEEMAVTVKPAATDELGPTENTTSTEKVVTTAIEKPTPIEEPAATEKERTTAEPVVTKEPGKTTGKQASIDEPKVTKKSGASKEQTPMDKPLAIRKARATKGPASIDEPIATKKPRVTKEPTPIEEPVMTRRTRATKKQAAIDKQIVTKKPEVSKETAPIDELIATKKPRVTNEPTPIAEPVVIRKTRVTKKTTPIGQTVVTEKPGETKEHVPIEEPVDTEKSRLPEERATIDETKLTKKPRMTKEGPTPIVEPVVIRKTRATKKTTPTEETLVTTKPGDTNKPAPIGKFAATIDSRSTEESVSLEETIATKKLKVTKEPAQIVEAMATGKPSLIEEPAPLEKSVSTIKPKVTEKLTTIDKTKVTEKPRVTKKPASIQEPVMTEKSRITKEQAPAETPKVTEKAGTTKEPAPIAEPVVTEKFTAAVEAALIHEPASRAKIEQSTYNHQRFIPFQHPELDELTSNTHTASSQYQTPTFAPPLFPTVAGPRSLNKQPLVTPRGRRARVRMPRPTVTIPTRSPELHHFQTLATAPQTSVIVPQTDAASKIVTKISLTPHVMGPHPTTVPLSVSQAAHLMDMQSKPALTVAVPASMSEIGTIMPSTSATKNVLNKNTEKPKPITLPEQKKIISKKGEASGKSTSHSGKSGGTAESKPKIRFRIPHGTSPEEANKLIKEQLEKLAASGALGNMPGGAGQLRIKLPPGVSLTSSKVKVNLPGKAVKKPGDGNRAAPSPSSSHSGDIVFKHQQQQETVTSPQATRRKTNNDVPIQQKLGKSLKVGNAHSTLQPSVQQQQTSNKQMQIKMPQPHKSQEMVQKAGHLLPQKAPTFTVASAAQKKKKQQSFPTVSMDDPSTNISGKFSEHTSTENPQNKPSFTADKAKTVKPPKDINFQVVGRDLSSIDTCAHAPTAFSVHPEPTEARNPKTVIIRPIPTVQSTDRTQSVSVPPTKPNIPPPAPSSVSPEFSILRSPSSEQRASFTPTIRSPPAITRHVSPSGRSIAQHYHQPAEAISIQTPSAGNTMGTTVIQMPGCATAGTTSVIELSGASTQMTRSAKSGATSVIELPKALTQMPAHSTSGATSVIKLPGPSTQHPSPTSEGPMQQQPSFERGRGRGRGRRRVHQVDGTGDEQQADKPAEIKAAGMPLYNIPVSVRDESVTECTGPNAEQSTQGDITAILSTSDNAQPSSPLPAPHEPLPSTSYNENQAKQSPSETQTRKSRREKKPAKETPAKETPTPCRLVRVRVWVANTNGWEFNCTPNQSINMLMCFNGHLLLLAHIPNACSHYLHCIMV